MHKTDPRISFMWFSCHHLPHWLPEGFCLSSICPSSISVRDDKKDALLTFGACLACVCRVVVVSVFLPSVPDGRQVSRVDFSSHKRRNGSQYGRWKQFPALPWTDPLLTGSGARRKGADESRGIFRRLGWLMRWLPGPGRLSCPERAVRGLGPRGESGGTSRFAFRGLNLFLRGRI